MITSTDGPPEGRTADGTAGRVSTATLLRAPAAADHGSTPRAVPPDGAAPAYAQATPLGSPDGAGAPQDGRGPLQDHPSGGTGVANRGMTGSRVAVISTSSSSVTVVVPPAPRTCAMAPPGICRALAIVEGSPMASQR